MSILHVFFHLILALLSLLKPSGTKALIAENLLLKQQILIATRGRKRSPSLTSIDRFTLASLATLISTNRLQKVTIILKPETLLRFHQHLVKRKYRLLYSRKTGKKPGPKGPSQEMIQLVITFKKNNPHLTPDRIALQIRHTFGITLTDDQVHYILKKHYKPTTKGPSWLTFLGNTKDSLWSLDLFRCESISLKSHWIMVVMDQHTRTIIGYSVHKGEVNGAAACHMLNRIFRQHHGPPPKYLSTDNAKIFDCERWQATLNILDVEQSIKSIPHTPVSHPFIERVISTTRRECLDHLLFWNKTDLERKLERFRLYYNETRGHMALNGQTPSQKGGKIKSTPKQITNYGWKSYCNDLYKLPVIV